MDTPVDARHLRNALGRFATGVAIVTCIDGDGLWTGLTANSFSGLSLEPALVLWSLRGISPVLDAFSGAPRFAVNVLTEAQVDLSRRFASRGDEKFAEGAWALGTHGAPVLAGCTAVFECETVAQHAMGDHRLFIGRVLACAESALPPLVFQAGHYHLLGEVLWSFEAKWIEMFAEVFRLCGVKAGDVCAVLSETQTRPELPELSALALQRIGARAFHLVLPARVLTAPAPVRSTGASEAIGGIEPVVRALAGCVFVADCTVEGLQHAAELPRILAGGARVLAISHEHPEILERCLPRAEDELPVRDAMRRLKAAREMHVVSDAGTDLRVKLAGAVVGGVWGYTTRPGTLSHWPGGLVLAFPAAASVDGTLVLDRGDVNLTFKRYLTGPVRLAVEADHVVRIEGDAVEAELMRGYFDAWNDPAAYAVSHLGWGLNRRARWDAMSFYDKADFNGTELRAFAGNFLYSTGANEVAGRHTAGHFDLPLRGCTVLLDGVAVVEKGRLT